MKAVNSNLSVMKSEMSLVTAEFGKNDTSTDGLAKKQQVLSEQVEQQKEKVRALNAMYEKQVKLHGEDSAAADKYKKALNAGKAELLTYEKALADTNKQIEKNAAEEKAANEAKKASEKLSHKVAEALSKVGESAKKNYTNIRDLAGSFDKLKGDLEKIRKLGAAVVSPITGTAAALGKLTAAGAAGATAIGALAVTGFKTLADYATQAAKDGNPAFASLAGNLTELDSASSAAKAALGTVLLPALETLSSKGAALLTDFTAAMEGANGDTEQMGKVMSEYIKKAVDLARETLPEFLQLGGDLLSGLGEGIIDNLPELLADAEVMITQLLDGVEANADKLGDSAATLITTLGLSLVKNAPKLLSSGLRIVLALVEGVLDAIPELVASVPQLLDDFKEAFAEQAPSMKDIGSRIVNGIWDGIKAGWDKVTGWVGNAIGKLTGNVTVSGAADGTHAGGLPYVPFDGYRAILHEGERVLTRHEAQDYRSGETKGSNTVNATVNIMELTEVQKERLFEQFNDWLGDQT